MMMREDIREVKVKVCGCVPGCVYEGNGRLEFVEYEWNSEQGCIDIRCKFFIEPKYYIPSWILPKGWYIWKNSAGRYWISSSKPLPICSTVVSSFDAIGKYELAPHQIEEIPRSYKDLCPLDSIYQQPAWGAE